MKTIKLKNILLGILTFILAIACNDYLEEDYRSGITTDSFFNSDGEADLAVNGLYTILHENGFYRGTPLGLDAYYMFGADLVGANRGENGEVHNYTFNESSTYIDGTWKSIYKLIRNASSIISNLEDNETLSEPVKNRILGEALFLRALGYYHLTNIWGNVPYFREFESINDLVSLPRTDKMLIRTDMKNDLERAFELLPGSYSGADLGRATKWAAATLKAKFHLFDEEWQLARDWSVLVINSPDLRLLDDYASVFDQSDPDNQYNDELIFVVDFTGIAAVDNTFKNDRTDHFNPRIRDEPKNPDQKQDLIAALAANNDNMTGFGKAIPLPEFALRSNWQEGDLRYDASITQEYEGIELVFPYYKKFWNLNQEFSTRNNHPENYIVFRLADVYLMAAEAENELNGPAGAYQYVNKVRERAFEPDQPISGFSQDQFRQFIRDERKYELAAEGHRRMDLIRWGILIETVLNTESRAFNNPAANIQPRNVLYPIFEQELLLNPALLESDPTNNGYR